MYKASDVAGHFGVALQTVYRWSDDMKLFMSPGAHPDTKDKEYVYSDNDMAVFSLMHDMRGNGSSTDTIITAIKTAIQMGTLPPFNGLKEKTDIVLNEQQYTELDSRVQSIIVERDELRIQLQDAQKQIAVLLSQVKGVEDLRTEIKELNREIGRLEARLEIMQDKD